MYSHSTVRDILETAIDSLVDNFSREPYIHRCEHSIHCELYTMLVVHRVLQGVYPLQGVDHRKTTLIHKEWPETIARPEKKGRRGNFDLVILNPEDIPRHTVKHFTAGRIRPVFVVEMGLNYKIDHLKNDNVKLANSGCGDGYLVHLWQPHKRIHPAEIDRLQTWCRDKCKVAVAVFTSDGIMVKHLKEMTLELRGK